jgi:hypothetical protein
MLFQTSNKGTKQGAAEILMPGRGKSPKQAINKATVAEGQGLRNVIIQARRGVTSLKEATKRSKIRIKVLKSRRSRMGQRWCRSRVTRGGHGTRHHGWMLTINLQGRRTRRSLGRGNRRRQKTIRVRRRLKGRTSGRRDVMRDIRMAARSHRTLWDGSRFLFNSHGRSEVKKRNGATRTKRMGTTLSRGGQGGSRAGKLGQSSRGRGRIQRGKDLNSCKKCIIKSANKENWNAKKLVASTESKAF